MASISLNCDGEIRVQQPSDDCPFNECVMIDLVHEEEDITYYRDTLFLHGTADQMRELARKLLAVLPTEAEKVA